MSKSRTYCIKMAWQHDGNPVVVEKGTTYTAAKKFLDLLQLAWRGRKLRPIREAHNRIVIGNLSVWFEEEKDADETG
jgi:hypothetical protein